MGRWRGKERKSCRRYKVLILRTLLSHETPLSLTHSMTRLTWLSNHTLWLPFPFFWRRLTTLHTRSNFASIDADDVGIDYGGVCLDFRIGIPKFLADHPSRASLWVRASGGCFACLPALDRLWALPAWTSLRWPFPARVHGPSRRLEADCLGGLGAGLTSAASSLRWRPRYAGASRNARLPR